MTSSTRQSASSAPKSTSRTMRFRDQLTKPLFTSQSSSRNVWKSSAKSKLKLIQIISNPYFVFYSPEQQAAAKEVQKLCSQQTPSSTTNGFFMKSLCTPVIKEDDLFKKYLYQIKQECAKRLLLVLYNPEWGTLDLKFWLQFSKRKFLKLDFS